MLVGVSHTGNTSVVLWNQGPRSTVNISNEKFFWPRVTAYVQGAADCGHYKWTLQQDGERRLTLPETINVKMSFIEQNITLWPPNNPVLNPVEYTVWRAPGASIPQQPWRYSHHSHVSPRLFCHPHANNFWTSYTQFCAILCVFSVNFRSWQSGIMTPKNERNI